MNISEQKLNEILAGIIDGYAKKGSISTNALCDILEKYDMNANQIDFAYKAIGEAGIQIVDEDQRDKELFEQAIFILTDEAVAKGVTDQQLLRQANQAIQGAGKRRRGRKLYLYGPVWAAAGAAVTGFAWLLTAFL